MGKKNVPNHQPGFVASGKHLHNYGKSLCLIVKFTISMAICHSYVKLPQGTYGHTYYISIYIYVYVYNHVYIYTYTSMYIYIPV